ncbi:MAG TPA: glycosyltransferase family A protein [Flavipsychrobacter sp.]|nr:glycosyltransferase family A protein [Flavipsychrobacter sp.]
MTQPAIVIAAYNRPHSLNRLLTSIHNANYEQYSNISLVISIDGGGPKEVLELAHKFEWTNGEKTIVSHNENIGLRQHIVSCGNLTETYGCVLLLEDDLFLSTHFYDYAVKATSFYQEETSIAGISLNNYLDNEYIDVPFCPLQNGYDAFFMQIPSSRGQVWTRKQWRKFKEFYNANPIIGNTDRLPESVKCWPESSWKKYYYKYMVDHDLYFVYPYCAHSSNFGDIGTHSKTNTAVFQVPLMNVRKEYAFPRLEESAVIYDAYLELLARCFWRMGVKIGVDFCVDLYGTKQLDLFINEYWLSTKDTSCPIERFAIDLVPMENNILLGFRGDEVSFGRREHFGKNVDANLYDKISCQYNTVAYDNGYRQGYRNGVGTSKTTITYRIGHYLLYPLRLFKKTITRQSTQIGSTPT